MAEYIAPGLLFRESEFTHGLTGACGPNALSMGESWAYQKYISTYDVQQGMLAHGWCDSNGVSNINELQAYAQFHGDNVAGYRGYGEPWAYNDFKSFVSPHLGKGVVVIEVANGQALKDQISGLGENARNLQYHFVLIVGWHDGGASPRAGGKVLPPGWWVCDGDNFAQGNVLQFYADSTLEAARPCAALALGTRIAPAPANGGHPTMAIPTGWHDDGAILTAPNNVHVQWGFRAWVLAHAWDANNWPIAAEYAANPVEPGNPSVGAGTRQDFRVTSLGWTSSKGVYQIWAGQDIAAMKANNDALTNKLIDAQKQLTAANTALATAQAQLATAQKQVQVDQTTLSAVQQQLTDMQSKVSALQKSGTTPEAQAAINAVQAISDAETAIRAAVTPPAQANNG